MAVYKVAQDVEAEDKLLGPFSFRQFIYLIIMVMGMGMMWGLGTIFIPLAAIPIPIVVLFGALALPLKKDQPMETYLGALISFFLKPRKRLWQPDGVEHVIEITVPKTDTIQRTKDLTHNEAQKRLAYLADLADSRGWSIRHSAMPNEQAVAAMVPDVYNEAQQTKDILDDEGNVALAFETMIGQADEKRRQTAIARMSTPLEQAQTLQSVKPLVAQASQAPTASIQAPIITTTADQVIAAEPIRYDPYPSMRQSMVRPVDEIIPMQQPSQQVALPEPVHTPVNTAHTQTLVQNPPSSTSVTPPSADILELANNTDLSIETIAHEANRRSKKSLDKEVVISLR